MKLKTHAFVAKQFAKKHYAVAENEEGSIVIRGESSFSSDVNVLLDEIKFRIDSQLS